MKSLFKKVETLMAATAFAEAGDVDTVRQLLNEEKQRKNVRPSAHDYQRPSKRPTLRAD